MSEAEELLAQVETNHWLQKASAVGVLAATGAGLLAMGTAEPAAAYQRQADGGVIVEQGDNLWNIVREETGRNGKTLVNNVHDVATDNHLSNPNQIKPGQRLSLSAIETPSSKSDDTYTLEHGDTLWDVVKAHYGYATAELVTQVAKRSGINMERYFPNEIVRFATPEQSRHAKNKSQSSHTQKPVISETEPVPHATVTITSQRQTVWDLSSVLAAINHTNHEAAMKSIMAANPGMVPRELQLGDTVKLPGISDKTLDETLTAVAHLVNLQQAVSRGSAVVPNRVVPLATNLVNQVAEQPTDTKALAHKITVDPSVTIETSPGDRVKRSVVGIEDDGATFTHDTSHPGETAVSPRLLQIIEGLAETHHITITSLTTGNHVPNSDHYRGEAVDIKADASSPEIFKLLYQNRERLGIDDLIWAFAPEGTKTLNGGQEFQYDADTLKEHEGHIHLSVTDKNPLIKVPTAVPPTTPTQAPKPSPTPEATQPTEIKLSIEENTLIESFNITPQQKQFLKDVVVAARRVAQTEPINPAVMVAQALNESDWGRKAPHFNYFGIKGASPSGNSFKMDTKEDDGSGNQYSLKQAQFRAYNSPEEAFRDYAAFVQGPAWFADAIANHEHWQAYLNGLQNSNPYNYATSIEYVKAISSLIREYGLAQLTHTQP